MVKKKEISFYIFYFSLFSDVLEYYESTFCIQRRTLVVNMLVVYKAMIYLQRWHKTKVKIFCVTLNF